MTRQIDNFGHGPASLLRRIFTSIAAMIMLLLAMVMSPMTSPVMAGGEDRPVSGVLAAASGPVIAGPMGADDGAKRTLAVGNKVFFEDEVVTGDGVRAQILLRDGTTFSIGEGARLILDEFVFDPRTNEGGVGVVIKKGAFRFVSGKIAKVNPRNMRVLAGNTAIAVRGTEVIGTVGSGSESVILISGQVDLVSIGGDCVASGSGGDGGDMFGIGADGGLEFKADVVASPPEYCNRSLVRAGFGVQVAGGQIASPGRIDTDTIDAVIEAITITEIAEEPAEAGEAETESVETGDAGQTSEATETEAAEGEASGSDPEPVLASANTEAEAAPAAEAAPDAGTVTDPAPSPEAEDGLSEFDKVVMRAFGLLDEDQSAAASADNTDTEQQGQLLLAASRAEEDLDADDESDSTAGSGRPDDSGLGDQIEDTPTGEETRNEVNVDEAVLDLNQPAAAPDDSDSSDAESEPTPANNAPTLASISGIAFSDSANDDSFTLVSASLTGNDSDSGDTLTYAISGGSADSSVSGFTHSRTGTYGTLYLNSSSGAYRYVPNDSAIEGLTSNSSEDFTLSVSDGTASASQTLTASIAGVNDTPVFDAISAISLTDTAATDSFTETTGTLSSSERDSGQTITYSATGQQVVSGEPGFTHGVQGSYGTLIFNATTGAYEFSPDDTAINAAANAVSDSFTFTASDSTLTTNQTLTVNVAGTDDGPTAINTIALANAGGTQNTGVSANLRVGTTTDAEGDAVSDISSALNALPAWLTFGNQTLGSGVVEYYWVVGANEAPWRNGTATLQLQARSGSIDSARETISITFTCQSSYCNDYLQSDNAVTSPVIDSPTDIGQIRTGMKIGADDFLPLTVAQRDALFDTSIPASGDFRVIFTTPETGSGSPTGSWTFDQQVNVDYQSRTLTVVGTVSANNITYFDGGSDDFTYSTEIDYNDLVLGVNSAFGKSSTTSGNATFDLKEGNGVSVNIEIADQIGIVVDTNGAKAAVINTDVTPLASNPAGHNDTSNKLIEQQWRILEPQ